MKQLRKIVLALLFVPHLLWAQRIDPANGLGERAYFVQTLVKIADPVLTALSKNELKKVMPIEAKVPKDRAYSTHLEAFGRLLSGMAPWLELGLDNTDEGKLRKKYIELAVLSIKNATNPDAPDFLNFSQGRQPLVDAAFFAHALLRAPRQLWGNLDAQTQKNVVEALKSSRDITPSFSNWLMFSATIEAALEKFDKSGDKMRLDYAVRQHMQWYKGDGAYGDGPEFHWDYYNSFVIQPMLLNVTKVMKEENLDLKNNFYGQVLERARRFAAVQERLISPEGTFPPIGRSIAYRFGAFQLLSQVALMKELPEYVTPQQVRSALYAVVKRQIEMPDTFDSKGWLRIGFAGHQPGVGENYISTGSLYLCSEVFLILGLSQDDAFWQAPYADWTAKKAWSGQPFPIDKALKEN